MVDEAERVKAWPLAMEYCKKKHLSPASSAFADFMNGAVAGLKLAAGQLEAPKHTIRELWDWAHEDGTCPYCKIVPDQVPKPK